MILFILCLLAIPTPLEKIQALRMENFASTFSLLEKEHTQQIYAEEMTCLKKKDKKCLQILKEKDQDFMEKALAKKKAYLEWVHAKRIKNLEAYTLESLDQAKKNWETKINKLKKMESSKQ